MLATLKNIYNNICNSESKPAANIGFANVWQDIVTSATVRY